MIILPIGLWDEDTLWCEPFLLKDVYIFFKIMLSEKQSNTYNAELKTLKLYKRTFGEFCSPLVECQENLE